MHLAMNERFFETNSSHHGCKAHSKPTGGALAHGVLSRHGDGDLDGGERT